MIESIFIRPYTRRLHESAPCLAEREAYLTHLQSIGRSKAHLQHQAEMLLHVIRSLQLDEMRPIHKAEIYDAAIRWLSERRWQRSKLGPLPSMNKFTYAAGQWLRFQNVLVMPTKASWFDQPLLEYERSLIARGLSPATRIRYVEYVSIFFKWIENKRSSIRDIAVLDLDEYVDYRRKGGISTESIRHTCGILKRFFAFGETQLWCQSGFAAQLWVPRRRKRVSEDRGPTWKEVKRLIHSCNGNAPTDLRAKAVVMLCAIYGLRNGEIINLSLNDFDWRNEIMTVRRLKNSRIQQFPIQYEVGEAIIKYLKGGRPRCSCRNLFVTKFIPHHPMTTIWPIIARRMRQFGIESRNRGSHALRHACATELLRKGTSLREIADFLGHRGLSSVRIYARHDLRSLREVAKIRLGGLR